MKNILGIDIGSTTVKIAILDKDKNMLFWDYKRHFADIQNTLKNIGYTVNGEGAKCPNRSKGTLEKQDGTYLYCVYYFENDRSSVDKRTNKEHEPIYYNYSVASYIYIELPIVGAFKIPVYTKGERIYNFSHKPSAWKKQ